MSLSPPLAGVVGTLPLPNTTPTPKAGEDVRAEDVQLAAQGLLNECATLEAYMNDGTKTIAPGRVNETYVTPQTHTYAASITLDMNNGLNHEVAALTGNITIAFANFPTGRLSWVRLVQDGVGSRTVTWSGGVYFGSFSDQPTATASYATYYLFTKASDGAIACLSRN